MSFRHAALLALLLVAPGCGGQSEGHDAPDSVRGWGAPQVLGAGQFARLAVAANGNAVVVWQRVVGTLKSVWGRAFDPTRGWLDETMLFEGNSAETLGDYALPVDLAINAQGHAATAWYVWTGNAGEFWTARFVPGEQWQAAELVHALNAEPGPEARATSVAVSGDGSTMLVFSSSPGRSDEHVLVSRRERGGPWSAPTSLTEGAYDLQSLFVAADEAGSAVATWTDRNGGPWTVSTTRFEPASGWQPREVMPSAIGVQALVAAGDGSFIGVWQDAGVWANRHTAEAGWSAGQLVDASDNGTTVEPDVAAGASGNAVMVWTLYEQAAFSSRFDPGLGWSAPERVAVNVGSTRVAQDGHGNAIAVWEQLREDGVRRVQTSRHQLESGWSAPLDLESESSYDPHYARVGADALGNAFVVWSAGEEVWVRRYTL